MNEYWSKEFKKSFFMNTILPVAFVRNLDRIFFKRMSLLFLEILCSGAPSIHIGSGYVEHLLSCIIPFCDIDFIRFCKCGFSCSYSFLT